MSTPLNKNPYSEQHSSLQHRLAQFHQTTQQHQVPTPNPRATVPTSQSRRAPEVDTHFPQGQPPQQQQSHPPPLPQSAQYVPPTSTQAEYQTSRRSPPTSPRSPPSYNNTPYVGYNATGNKQYSMKASKCNTTNPRNENLPFVGSLLCAVVGIMFIFFYSSIS